MAELLHELGRFLALYGLETLWMSLVLLPVIALAAWTLRAHSAHARGRLWWGYLLLIPVLPWVAQMAGDAGMPQRAVAPIHAPASAAPSPAADSSAVTLAPESTPAATRARSETLPPLIRDGNAPPGLQPSRIAAPAPRQPVFPAILGGLYLLGVMASLVPIALGYLRVMQWRFRSRPCADRRVQTAFEDAAHALGLKRPARLRESAMLSAPATVKLLRTAVLVPPGFADSMTRAELFAVAVHETEHVRRRDAAKLQALSLLRAMLWCHPLAWLAARRILHLMECNADEAAVTATRAPLPYAKLLTRLAAADRGFVPLGAAGLLWGRAGLAARVAAVLSGSARRRVTLAALAIIMALLILGLGAVSVSPLRQLSDRAAVRQAINALPEEGSFERVLQFEVTDAETGEVIPEVRFWAGHHGTPDWHDEVVRERRPIPGRFDHRVPEPWSFVSFEVGAPGYGSHFGQRLLFNAPRETPVRIALHRAKTLSGLVVDENGAPIEGAELVLQAWKGYSSQGQVIGRHMGRTNAEGRWQLYDIPSNAEWVYTSMMRLNHPDHVLQWVEMHPSPVHAMQGTVFRMTRGEPFGGRVVDTQGAPVAGASVEIFRGNSTTTDDDGYFLIPHMLDESHRFLMRLTIHAAGFAQDTRILGDGDLHTGHEFILHPARPLQVRLKDRRGRPLANTEIWMSSEVGLVDRLLSNGDGIITLEDAWPDMEWQFSAIMWPGGPLGPSDTIALTPGDTVHDIRLDPAPMVNIIAVDADTGRRIEHFRVTPGQRHHSGMPPTWRDWIPWLREELGASWHHTQAQDAAGVFRWILDRYDDDFPPVFRVEADGYQPFVTPAEWTTRRGADIRVRLVPGEPIPVHIRKDDGEPVTNVYGLWRAPHEYTRILDGRRFDQWEQAFARTAVDGTLTMGPIDLDRHALVVVADEGYAMVRGTDIPPDATIRLTPWSRVEGTMDPGMVARAQHGVNALHDSGILGPRVAFVTNGVCDDDGRFEIARVPTGTIDLGLALHPSATWHATTPWTTVVTEPGETTRVHFEEGQAVTAHMELPGAAITWLDSGPATVPIYLVNRTVPVTHARLEAGGRLTIDPLPPGHYEFRNSPIRYAGQYPTTPRPFHYISPTSFTIDEGPPGPPMDIGTLTLRETNAGG